MVRNASLLLCVAALLCGCASTPPIRPVNAQHQESAPPPAAGCTKDAAAPRAVQLNMVGNLMKQGALYAALAHLDSLDREIQRTPDAQYLRAELLRRTGRGAEAATVYRGLLETCLAGAGHHGLGLIAAQRGELKAALTELAAAGALLPTDARVRNDYGYALLLDNQRESAAREFLTALELGDVDGHAAMNYLTLLLMEGRNAEAQDFAQRSHLSEADVEALRQRAAQLVAHEAPKVGQRTETDTGAKP